MVELDINGTRVVLSDAEAIVLRDAAALQAGRSEAARNLSLILERGLNEGRCIALQRGELRALHSLVADDAGLDHIRTALQFDAPPTE